jgi:hypothetical protein
MALSLRLGTVLFAGFEIPQKIGPLGGKAAIVRHEFPGSVITQTTLGSFPPNMIRWSGILLGTNAFARAQQIDRMRAQGVDVQLNYGPFAYLGKVADFSPAPEHQWRVPYEITFKPAVDLSGVGFIAALNASAEQALSAQGAAFDDVVAGDDGLALPGALTQPAADVDSSVQAGLLDGNGTVAGISAADGDSISEAVSAFGAAAAPIIAGQDATQASPALDALAYASAISAVVASPKAPVRYLTLINPNLFSLAAQYFGDPSAWSDIAAASGLSDPQPVGQYMVVIPAS